MKKTALFFIKIYQKTLSPDHGVLKHYLTTSKCRFYPTCSEYTYEAIEKYGFLKGFLKGVNRIKKCHPWHKGGYDPLK
jgi:putative membrane protein insertion efficiency factor